MSWLSLARLTYWLVTGTCWAICGWVIFDNQRKHRWYLFERQLIAEWREFRDKELQGWVFWDGEGMF